MKTKVLFFLALILMAVQGWSAPVDLKKAQMVAQNFTITNGNLYASTVGGGIRLAHAEQSDKIKNQAVFYVFDTGGSFVIVSGDDRAYQVLAYGDGEFDMNKIPCGMKFMLGMYKEQIDYLLSHPKFKVEKKSSATPSLNATTVSKLLTTTWDQCIPYCLQCPTIGDYYCATGCAATALAQIMYYWKYPSTAPALSAYTTATNKISVEALPSKTINWGNMIPIYIYDPVTHSYNCTEAQANAVAWLMRYVGQAEHMDYGTINDIGGSGASDYDVLAAAKKFGYNSGAKVVEKDSYPDENEWESMIQAELTAKRPVYYGGYHKTSNGKYAGHAFVVDGYDASTKKYHINWGANGYSDNYFPLNAFKDGDNYTYNYYQSMIVDLRNTTTILSINPNPVVFNNKIVGNTYTASISIKGYDLTGNLTLKLSGATGVFSINKTSITKSAATSGTTVTVTYKPTAAGTKSATLTISGGGLGSNKTVSIKGTAVAPTITPSVTSLNFGTTAVNKAVKKTFTVKGTDLTGSLTLLSNNSYFTVSPTTITAADAKAGKTVTVTYKPTAGGSHSATLTIKGGSAANKTVSLSGNCAEITPSLTILNLGTTAVNKAVQKIFVVKAVNLTGSLTLTSNSSYFTISPATITAAEAKAGKSVTVTYKPTASGSHSATLTIKGGSAANKTVSLSGKCAEITTSASSLLFAGYRDSRTLKVTGINLTGSLTLSTNNSNFTVSPTTITLAEAKAGKTVTVKCNVALNVQRATGTLTIRGGSAANKLVSLSFNATGMVPYAGLISPDEEQENEFNIGELELSQNDWNAAVTSMDELAMDVKVYAEGSNIVIESPLEQKAIISDITGRARRVNLQAGRNVIPANGKGVYIVCVGKKTAKLMLK